MKPQTTTNAGTGRADEVNEILDRAIAALTVLDATKLEAMEARVTELVSEGDRAIFAGEQTERETELREISSRHRLLGTLLATTDLNLAVLGRLHNRHAMGDTTWVR